MNWLQALILGLIQGLTEFLPVSSSGHLELSKILLGVDAEKSLLFTVVVHGATVLSTIIVFRKDLAQIILKFFEFKWNFEMRYVIKIFISMIPVLIVGLFFKELVEGFFTGNLLLVGSMLLITAVLLAFTYYAKAREKAISYWDALVIGAAQALAVMPGISRSGATISTGLLLGNKRANVARFSFLMVLIPIIGANMKDLYEGTVAIEGGLGVLPLLIGFLAAFISGLLACRWMIKLVKRGKLIYFAIYCAIIGFTAIGFYYFG
ncbi:MAG: undecaprenyl-diphosphate phosphatase [Bacteroidales bacterium]|nr:undecaprenyl-diphosphate phosphatase [Bacteroidales bacterium]MCF8332745.1 undecaprenyl-diphosphate phosphatase [Bacteroidales bacterium]